MLAKHVRFFLQILHLTIIILFFPTLILSTEKSAIAGYIYDEISHHPIADVNIYFENLQIGTTTDEKGYFLIENIPAGKISLVIEHVGFQKQKITLHLQPKTKKKLNIFLIPRTIALQNITFTANRSFESVFKSHQSIAIADEQKIELRTSPNTADALREVSGILVQKTTAGHGSPIIRGMIGKDVLLLYNSIRLNKPTFRFGANQYMNTINAEILQRIEIVKGPGSVMYGSDAIGGLINMIPVGFTAALSTKSFQDMASFRYGSADQSRLANAALVRQFGKISLLANLGIKKIGDLVAGAEIGRQEPTGYNEWDANFKINWAFSSNTDAELDFLTVQQNHVPRFDKYVTGQYQKYEYHPQNRYLCAITVHHQPSASRWIQKLRWNFSYQFEQEGITKQKTGKTAIVQDNNELTTWGSYLQINSILPKNHIMTYGYEIYYDRVHSLRHKKDNESIQLLRPAFPDGSSYFSSGIFINDQWLIQRNLEVTIGLRWSYVCLNSVLGEPFGNYHDKNQDLTTSFGFSYQIRNGWNFVGTYSRGFRAPNFNDTVVLKVSNAGVDAPSPDLKPEKSHNFELGIKSDLEKFSGSFFVFYNQLIDLIDRYKGNYLGLPFFDENGDRVRDPDEVDIYQKRNAGKAYIAGWEFEGKYQINHKWSMDGFLFWTYGQNKTLNEPLSRIPPLMGLLSLKFIPQKNWQLNAFIRAAGKQSRLSTRDKEDSRIPDNGTPAWKTFNLRLRYFWADKYSINLTFENIFDETYKEHGSGVFSPGRNFVIAFRFQK